MDITSACTFYLPATKELVTWSVDGSLNASLKIPSIPAPPDRWVITSRGGAFVGAGNTLYAFDKTGKQTDTFKLPGPLADIAWDAKGFVILINGADPYLERRDLKDGSIIWTTGNKPKDGGIPSPVRHRLTIADDGNIILVSDSRLDCLVIDGAKGRVLGQTLFTLDGAAPPPLRLDARGRGAICWLSGGRSFISTARGADFPGKNLQGLVLVQHNLENSTLTLKATGLDESHEFMGVYENTAYFTKTGGGLAQIPLS